MSPIPYHKIILRHYAEDSLCYRILMKHSRQVAEKALAIARRLHLDLEEEAIEAACMLHDVGIAFTDAPGIDCHGKEHYLRHGIIGAQLLRDEGQPEWLARVAERHTGAGITAADIARHNLPLPHRDMLPETLLERLVCYADKFYSKSGDMEEKPLYRVRASMAKISPEAAERFEKLHKEFSNITPA